MEIHYTYKAVVDLERLPHSLQKRIATKMRFFASQEDPLEFAEHLTDRREGQFRFRVGDYRIIFDVISDAIFVLKIGRRDAVYE